MLDIFNALVSFQPMIAPVIDQLIMPLIQFHSTVGIAMGPGTIAAEDFANLRNQTLASGAAVAARVGKAAGRKAKVLGGKAKALAARLRRRGKGLEVAPARSYAICSHERQHCLTATVALASGRKRDLYRQVGLFVYSGEGVSL